MNKLIALMVSVVMAGTAFSGATTHFALDTRSGMRLASAGSTLAVDYSPDFSSVQDVETVRVLTNGTIWVESVVAGTKDFTFGDIGLYQFTHQVLTNGVVAEEMSAWYAVRSAADYLGVPGLVFSSEGDADWFPDFETSHDGEASMRSGAVGTSQTSWIETTVDGAGTLTFVWKADGLLNRGKPANYVQYVLDGGDPVQVAVADWTSVEVSPKVASVAPYGAKVRVVSGATDITAYLDIPGTTGCDDGGVVATQADGVIDLTKATVKEEIVKEALDVEKWTPTITVKGGKSAFYSIGVGKGE